MKFYLEQIERSTSKTGNEFLKCTCTGTDKNRKVFYLWENVNELNTMFNVGHRIFDFEITPDPSFPKIVSFSCTDGALNEFYTFIYSSDEEAARIFEALLASVTDPFLHSLAQTVFLLPGPAPFETIKDCFIVIPAAKAYHHDFRYGLLQHSHQVMTFINRICEAPMFESSLDKQLAITAGLLHDVGKCYEYSFNGVSADYGHTFEVNQIFTGSHLYKGAEMIAVAFNSMAGEFSDEERARVEHLKHCVLAHHLQRDWGSVPKQPQTLEAYLCFLADYFSAQFGKFEAIDWSGVSLDNLYGATSKFDSFIAFNKI